MNTRFTTREMLNDPFFIGFENVLNKLSVPRPAIGQTYPPYNLIKTDENTYLIELAVAGFDEEDFDIELQDGVLTVKGDVGTSEFETDYIHKGIAARAFERKFTLADTIKVDGAHLKQGMLTIRLVNEIPEEKKPIKIPLGSGPELLIEEE